MTVVVLGSINADVFLNVPRLPRPGETIRATSTATFSGGKGANQAVAAARMGAPTSLIGRVGDDASGRMLRETLDADGIDISAVHIDPDAPTGTALITVAEHGENTIVTSGGANHRVGRRELDALRAALPVASILLIQLEIPMDAVDRGGRARWRRGRARRPRPGPRGSAGRRSPRTTRLDHAERDRGDVAVRDRRPARCRAAAARRAASQTRS